MWVSSIEERDRFIRKYGRIKILDSWREKMPCHTVKLASVGQRWWLDQIIGPRGDFLNEHWLRYLLSIMKDRLYRRRWRRE
jgi:hypothetical protein